MNKKVLALLVIISVTIIGGLFSVYSMTKNSTGSGTNQIVLKYTGVECHQVIRADGTVEPQACTHNIITNRGKEMVKQALNMTAAATWNLVNLTVGNLTGSQAATDVDMPGIYTTTFACGMSPTAATYTYIGTGNSSLNAQWTSTCANVYVNETGIYNQTGASLLFAEANWTATTTTLQNGDKLNVTYYWWIS